MQALFKTVPVGPLEVESAEEGIEKTFCIACEKREGNGDVVGASVLDDRPIVELGLFEVGRVESEVDDGGSSEI